MAMDIDVLLFETASAVIVAVVLLAIFQRIWWGQVMPRFWLSGPRLFNGLVRPGISFSGRELKALGRKAPKVAENATLGICRRRPDGAMTLAIPGKNGEAEHEPGLVPVAAFFFSRVDDAIDVRNGALQRLGGRAGADNWISDKSLGQITQAIRTEAAALGIELPWARVRVAPGEPETPPAPRMSWADIAVASLLPLLFIAVEVGMWINRTWLADYYATWCFW
jgi:hypothetical protein